MKDEEKARKMLPKMPEEVFQIWIAPLIKTGGWPFLSVASRSSGKWFNNLGGHSLQVVSKLDWHLQNLPGSLAGFSPDIPKRISLLAQQYSTGIQKFDRVVINGPARYRRALQYVVTHGNIPKPIVVIKGVRGMCILDGNHRMAAMFSAGKLPRTSFPAWVGD